MVKIELTENEASELHSLVVYELREAERHYISDATLRVIELLTRKVLEAQHEKVDRRTVSG